MLKTVYISVTFSPLMSCVRLLIVYFPLKYRKSLGECQRELRPQPSAVCKFQPFKGYYFVKSYRKLVKE